MGDLKRYRECSERVREDVVNFTCDPQPLVESGCACLLFRCTLRLREQQLGLLETGDVLTRSQPRDQPCERDNEREHKRQG